MADDLIPHQVVTLVSIIGGLICIYLTSLPFGEIFAMIATVLGIVFGTNTLRHIGKYSLGTGVPSIVYMLTAVGLVSTIAGIILSITIKQYLLYPLLSMFIAVICALIVSLICIHVFKIQVEILTKSFISIALATVISIIAMAILVSSTFDVTIIQDTVVDSGLIIILMILTVMAIQNPYNSCMGPNEDQYRTLSLSLSNAFIMLFILSIVSMLNNDGWYIFMIISIICWIISIKQYFKYTKQQAALIKWSGLWQKDDKGGL